MRFRRIICILFSAFTFIGFAKTKVNTTVDKSYREKLIDSLYLSKTRLQLDKDDAQRIIESYGEINEGEELTNKDLETLSIGYAALNQPGNASKYLEKYIKQSHNIEILDSQYLKNIKNSEGYNYLMDKYYPDINGWILLFFSISVIGIFVSLILNIKKKADKLASVLIGFFVFFHSLFIIHLCLHLSRYEYKFPHSLFITISFSYLYGPLLFFYFKRISEKYVFKLRDIIHLAPTILIFLYFLPIYMLSSNEKLHLMFNGESINSMSIAKIVFISKFLSLSIYCFMIYRVYSKNKLLEFKKEALNWQTNVIVLNLIYTISYGFFGVTILKLLVNNNNYLLYFQIFSITIIVLYISYVAYVQPEVINKKLIFNSLLLKYQKSGLTEDYSIELKDQLLKLFYEDKIYKENNINLDYLSERLDTNRHSTSQVINEHFNMNFFNLINKFRIEEAQEIFKSDFNSNLNIIDVAYDVGFNNKVTFNKAFKEHTNLTPSQYIKSLKKQKALDIA